MLTDNVLKVLASSEQDKEWEQAKATPMGSESMEVPLSLCLHLWPGRQNSRQGLGSAHMQLHFVLGGECGNWLETQVCLSLQEHKSFSCLWTYGFSGWGRLVIVPHHNKVQGSNGDSFSSFPRWGRVTIVIYSISAILVVAIVVYAFVREDTDLDESRWDPGSQATFQSCPHYTNVEMRLRLLFASLQSTEE